MKWLSKLKEKNFVGRVSNFIWLSKDIFCNYLNQSKYTVHLHEYPISGISNEKLCFLAYI